MGNKKRKKRKKNRGRSARQIFLVTLGLTLACGLFVLAVMKISEMGEKGQEDFRLAEIEKEEIDAAELERFREGAAGEAAELSLGEEAADDGFDENGYFRDENGRILIEKRETEKEEVTLLFAGDILFDDSYTVMITLRQRANGIYDCFSPETLEEMAAADIYMLNNECTYPDRGTPTEGKQYTFRAKPENVKLLDDIGVDIVSLANNHAYDYGEISLLDSLATLEEDDMPYVGAGRNLEDASETVYFQVNGQKIAFISATQIERQSNPDTRGAKEDAAGVFRCMTETEIYDRVAKAKENGAFTVVYIHWGTEKTDELDWLQPVTAKQLAEAGADLIIGNHAHVLQAIAGVDGVPTIYSLGNFWFNSGTCDTCFVKVVLKEGKMESFQFIPVRQSGCYTKILTGAEKEAVLSYMRGISGTVTIDAEGYVSF